MIITHPMLCSKDSWLFSQSAVVCVRVGICRFSGTAISYHFSVFTFSLPIPYWTHPKPLQSICHPQTQCYYWAAIPPDGRNLLPELLWLHNNVCHDSLFSMFWGMTSTLSIINTFFNIIFSKGWRGKFQASRQESKFEIILEFRKQVFQNKYSSK